MTTAARAASLVALAIFFPTGAFAQASEPRLTIWGAVGFAESVSGTVTTAYVPELKFFEIERGSAGQVVTL